MSPRLIFLAILFFSFTPPAFAQEAGFERRTTTDGVEVGIWYPATGTPERRRLGLGETTLVRDAPVPAGPHPLVVMSHGTGGDYLGHADTAVALARAGFIVAALTHPGDNWRDRSRATHIEDRPPALGALIDYMLAAWPSHASIDAKRIGAFGFSAGGFTVLAAAGGRPDLNHLRSHCAEHPAYFDCMLIRSDSRREPFAWPARRDARIKAVVAAAPALGFAFDRAGLKQVTIPIQLWRADDDHILPAPLYADAVRAALPRQPEFHTVPGAGHYDFLTPCADPKQMPEICTSAPGFDRVAFHQAFDTAVVAFFQRTLAFKR